MRVLDGSLLLVAAHFAVAILAAGTAAAQTPSVTVFEGARLIVGDGRVIDDGAFVVSAERFAQVGKRGELSVPAGAVRIDLTGKTVMPALVDLHGHLGYQNLANGTMSKETFTRENLIDHLQRLAYFGVGAVVGVGDLVDRAAPDGGRTGWGTVPLDLRNDAVDGAALFKTAGPGIAWPGSGAQGNPSRMDVAYPVTTVDEARSAVRDYAAMRPQFIKIWVDDREGSKMTLSPSIYLAILDEAHRRGIPVAAHNVKLTDAKAMMRAGIEGWMHVPVRGEDTVDDEILGIVRDRIARNDRPVMWMTPSLITAWMNTQGGPRRPAWLDDPLLTATYAPQHIEAYWATPLRAMSPDDVAAAKETFEHDAHNARELRAAGMKIVSGTDTGQSRHLIGLFSHLDLESQVAMGLTPMEAIVGATRDGAAIAGFDSGAIAAGKNADFIVLDANPLDAIANTRRIDRVILRGRQVPRADYVARWQADFAQAAN
jgi:imidazolonepropionase-like amidohydrolase